MFASALIVFREVIEAGIIIGVVLAATRGVPRRLAYVFGGMAAGFAGACLVALFANVIADTFAGNGQEIFNAGVLIVAVVMLGWHNVWMAKHGREMQQDAGALGRSVANGERSMMALAILVAVAVLREGSEVVLILYGVFLSGNVTPASMLASGVIGLAGGAAVTLLLYFGLVRIPMRHLFRVTGFLIAFLAAGLAAQAVGFLSQADLLRLGGEQAWNSSAILAERSWAGSALHVLFGYSDHPTVAQIVVYAAVASGILGLGRLLKGRPRTVTASAQTA